jgi:hypothetical protein
MILDISLCIKMFPLMYEDIFFMYKDVFFNA